jgi:hypothetical protein
VTFCGVVTQGFFKKEKIQSSAMCWKNHVFCFLRQKVILMDFLEWRGDTIVSASCVGTLKKLKTEIVSESREETKSSPSAQQFQAP